MSMNLICLTSSGGLPIFSKKKGESDPNFTFVEIGALNGVHMFSKSQDVTLQVTYTNDGVMVCWQEFEDCILLIVKGTGYTEKVLKNLLELTFNAMVFAVGLNDLKKYKNIEKLKRDLLKTSYPIIDILLKNIDTELHSFSDCLLCPENSELLERLIEFGEQLELGSPFSFILIRQKIAVASEGFWTLHPIDRTLIMSLLNSSNSAKMDVPIYLPKKSPNIAYRLVSVPILQGINICVLCGAEPQYADIENVAQQIWKNDLELLQLAEQSYPRNFPSNFQLDSGILGILLINKEMHKYVISRNVQQSSIGKRTASGTHHHRLDILRTFFHQSVNVIYDYLYTNDDNEKCDKENNRIIKSPESYWCSEYHKCHSYQNGENLICILYVASIPTHTMRLITQKTLKLILSEKDICWQ